MGQEGEAPVVAQDGKDKGVVRNQQGGVELSQYVTTVAEVEALKRARAGDDDAAAPNGAGQRMWDVTKEGVTKIPQGFMNSLDPAHILPNVGMGILIGAGTRLILPSSGPVARVAGGLMTAYFLGKPMVDTYYKAYTAETMRDMHEASDIFGNAIGGLPVSMAEGAVGAYIGSGLMGRALATQTARPFVEWKQARYDYLDAKYDAASAAVRNVAFEKFGIGRPVLRADSVTGVVPPHLLEELAKRNPSDPAYAETIKKMNAVRDQRHGIVGKQDGVAATEGTGARSVFDAKGEETVGIKVRGEGQPKTGIADVDNVYDYTGQVRDFYKTQHGRNSIDGKGMPMESTVNYGNNFENAFWDGQRMTYGRPGQQSPFETFVLRDVTGHEITHGVTEFEAGTVYRNQAGALNEHFSDVYGALIEQKVLNQKAGDASWLVGKGIWKSTVENATALRDMLNPGKAYDNPLLGKDPQPAHMRDFVTTRRDNGGVHINSGIPNKAFALFSKDVGGYAWETPGHIWFEARARAGSNPSFAQFAQHTLDAAAKLGHTAEIPKLQKAWADVGVKPNMLDTGTPVGGGVVPLIGNENAAEQARAGRR